MVYDEAESDLDARFVRWQAVFEPYYKELRTRREVSDKELADAIGVSPGAFSNWRWRSVPKKRLIANIALALADRETVKAHKIEQDLLEAIKADNGRAATPPLIRAQRGDRISLAVVDYSYFTDFFSDIGKTLLRFAATTPDSRLRINLATVVDSLDRREYDIVAAIFATPDRLRSMRFIRTPIKIGVAEVTLRAVADLGRDRVLPIVNEREVGASYVEYVLSIPRSRRIESEYKPETFAKHFRKALPKAQADERWRPTIFVDEMMALQVTEKVLDDLIQEVVQGRLDEQQVQQRAIWISSAPDVSAQMPNYNLGFAVYRPEVEWYEYLAESWEIFIVSNIEIISTQYEILFQDLRGLVDQAFARWTEQLSVLQNPSPALQAELSRFLDIWEHAIIRWLRFDDFRAHDNEQDKSDLTALRRRRTWSLGSVVSDDRRQDELPLASLPYPWDVIVARARRMAADKVRNKEATP